MNQQASTGSLRFESFEEFRVGDILRVSGFAFVPDQVFARDEPDLHAVEACRHPTLPRACEVNAVQLRQQVHAVGRAAKLDDAIVCLKVARGYVQRNEPKQLQYLHNTLAVLEIRSDEEVQVFRQPRSAMKRDRVSTNDKKFNAGRVEQCEQLVQVLVQQHCAPRGSELVALQPGQGAPEETSRPALCGRRRLPAGVTRRLE